MKVLQVLGDSAYGGGCYSALILSKFLMKNGYEVSLLSTNKETSKRFLDEGVPIVSPALITATVSPYRDVLGLIHLTKYLRKNKYDVVHSHTSKPGFIGRLAAHLAGIPVIIHTSHGYAYDDGYGFPKKLLFKYLEQKASKWSDLLITISKGIKQITIDENICINEKIALIENGVDWQKFQAALKNRDRVRSEFGIKKDQPLVSVICRLSPPKLPQDFVKAVHRLKQKQVNARYLIVGDGPMKPKVIELIRELGIEKDIIILGFRDDIPEILAAVDIFVLPTLFEGLSMSLLEAMASGKAIIATDILANRELLEDKKDALLVPTRNVKALEQAMLKLIEDKDQANEMGKAALEKVTKHYALDDSLRKTLTEYERLINKAGLKD